MVLIHGNQKAGGGVSSRPLQKHYAKSNSHRAIESAEFLLLVQDISSKRERSLRPLAGLRQHHNHLRQPHTALLDSVGYWIDSRSHFFIWVADGDEGGMNARTEIPTADIYKRHF